MAISDFIRLRKLGSTDKNTESEYLPVPVIRLKYEKIIEHIVCNYS